MPIDDWATGMWEQRVAPQLKQPPVGVTISVSFGVARATSTPSSRPPTGKPKAVLEALKKNQEEEAKRKKAEAKAKANGKVEKEEEKQTSSSSRTDLETPSSEEQGPSAKFRAKNKGQKKPTQKAMAKTPSETKGRNKRVLADNARRDGDATTVYFE